MPPGALSRLSFHPSILRKHWKKEDPVILILYQHFQHSSRKPEIPVDLKWRMCTEHIRVGPATNQTAVFFFCNVKLIFQELQRTLSISEPRPETRLPCHAPAGSLVPSSVQSYAAGSQKFFIFSVDQISWIKAV